MFASIVHSGASDCGVGTKEGSRQIDCLHRDVNEGDQPVNEWTCTKRKVGYKGSGHQKQAVGDLQVRTSQGAWYWVPERDL